VVDVTTGETQCTCTLGYLPVDNCVVNYAAVGSAVGAVAVLLVVLVIYWRRRNAHIELSHANLQQRNKLVESQVWRSWWHEVVAAHEFGAVEGGVVLEH
jgi:energy-converting hydrogenase Eha subunit H